MNPSQKGKTIGEIVMCEARKWYMNSGQLLLVYYTIVPRLWNVATTSTKLKAVR